MAFASRTSCRGAHSVVVFKQMQQLSKPVIVSGAVPAGFSFIFSVY